jgi:PAS domain S-box-containing protein
MNNRDTQKTEPPSILVVDDVPANLKLVSDILAAHGYQARPASSGQLALRSVAAEAPDLILLDVRMPDMDGYEVCRRLKADEKSRSIPVIFISALDDTSDKVRGFEAGGVDYITKPFQPVEVLARIESHLSLRRLQEQLEAQNVRLQKEIAERERAEEELRKHKAQLEELVAERTADLRQEIQERRRAEETIRLNTERLDTLLKLNQMTEASFDEITFFAFEEAVRLTGSRIGYLALLNEDETVLTMQLWSRVAMAECNIDNKPILFPVETTGLWGEAVRQRRPVITNDYTAPNPLKKGSPEGHVKLVRHMNIPVIVGSRIVLVAGVGNKEEEYDETDVQQLTLLMEGMWRLIEHRKVEVAIRESNERFRSVLRAATAYSIIGTDPDGLIKVFNEGAELMLGYRAEEVIDKATPELIHDPEEVAARASEMGITPGFEVFASVALRGETETREWTYIRKDGTRLAVFLTVTAMRSEAGVLTGFIGIARDITAEKKLEQELIQSQKMESVGLLAGGVAHDFNNLLTPILGYTEMLLAGFSEDDPRYKRLQQVKQAADRAKDLIRRLLAFSRKQIIELKTVNLGDIIRQFENMLHRTIRENIRIEVLISPSLGKVRADAGQIELVLLNLSINAQDAMPEGGLLTIEAKDIDLDESYTARHPEITPGPYVMLAVSDTGVGIDEKTMEHIFDPFFTTKELDKGTGLGLSTVYGVVRQHGGSISVYSEKSRGSVFKLFLPRMVEERTMIKPLPSLPDGVAHGSETILLAEDNEMVREFASFMLEELGYHVLAAVNPDRCVELAKGYQGSINLLLTDVIMPGMNGRELFELLKEIRTDLRVLYMSGYTSNVIGHHGVLDEGVAFIQKPFSIVDLSNKLRRVLDT